MTRCKNPRHRSRKIVATKWKKSIRSFLLSSAYLITIMIISIVFLKTSNKFVIMSLKKRQKKVVGSKRRKIRWRWTIIWKEVWKFKWFLPTVIAIIRKVSLKNWFKTSSLLLKKRQAKNHWGNQMKKFKKTTK